ncbi:MATE family efflux transporter [Ferrimonas pelagia]|uniref:MATE family efflux transporter n=1 Tax=Ferrimonas pelagia TaxID=1177826 RepID=A0ABP9ED98_9GAMM
MHEHQLTQGDPIAHLKRMTWPLLLAMTLLMSFNFVDAYFVSLLGTEELAAFSFTFPVTFTIFSMVIGLGIGTSTVVATARGQGDQQSACATGGTALVLSTGLVVVLCVPVWIWHDMIFQLLGADESMRALTDSYMEVWLLGGLFVAFPMIGNAVMRANGNTRGPSIVMAASAFINAVLDPLLIFGIGPFPELGLAGAALATISAYAISSVIILYMLLKQMNAVGWYRSWANQREASRQILQIAGPAAGANMLTPIAMAAMTAIVAQYGDAAVAALGVGSRLESLAILVVLTLSMSLPPLLSQNAAAGHMSRVRLLYHKVTVFVLVWQGAIALLLLLLSGQIGDWFGQEPEVSASIQLIVMILPLAWGAQGVIILTNSSFNALRRPMSALNLSVVRLFLTYLPLAWIGGKIAGLTGVFAGAAIANVITAIIAWRWMWFFLCCNRQQGVKDKIEVQ